MINVQQSGDFAYFPGSPPGHKPSTNFKPQFGADVESSSPTSAQNEEIVQMSQLGK